MPRPKKTDPQPQKTDSKTKTNQALDKSPSPKQQQTEQLTGSALIHKVRELDHLSKSQKAKACGYTTVKKNGGERVNLMQFMNALLQAEGIDFDSRQGASGRGAGHGQISIQFTS